MLIWNQVAYHHVAKTGGQSIVKVLVDNGRNGIYIGDRRKTYTDNVIHVNHRGEPHCHAPISKKKKVMDENGLPFDSFRIFAGIRNPLARMVSWWAMDMANDGAGGNKNMPLEEYVDYRLELGYDTVWSVINIDGEIPQNLHLVRTEEFGNWVTILENAFELPGITIPHINATKHKTWQELMSHRTVKRLLELDDELVRRFYPELLAAV